jgi:hypothetical protein
MEEGSKGVICLLFFPCHALFSDQITQYLNLAAAHDAKLLVYASST